MQRFEDSIPVWQELMKISPHDIAGPKGIGSAMVGLHRNLEAASAFEAAIKLDPRLSILHVSLGSAYLAAGEDAKALDAYRNALEFDPRPVLFNDIAYTLAEAQKNLVLALEYAQKAVAQEETLSQKINITDLQTKDLYHAGTLAAFWDTLGWVHFRLGNFDQAEKYLLPVWILSQSPAAADHLGQVYERNHKRQDAIRMYRLALQSPGRTPQLTKEIRDRLDRLSPPGSTVRDKPSDLMDELNRSRTTKLPRLVAGTANADFFLVFSAEAKSATLKVEAAKFINGAESLRSADSALMSVTSKMAVPDDGRPRILRRGTLACYPASGCSFVLLLPGDMHSLD